MLCYERTYWREFMEPPRTAAFQSSKHARFNNDENDPFRAQNPFAIMYTDKDCRPLTFQKR